ncbi:Uncharacterised protein [Mannheimia haemolytica]|uniref:Uncharacterized protein n=1 Tax=Mannheimia haemolytica TaxID=75985 RepID=A0A378MWF7_MANHA|nr:hypothetical protein J450_04015 [Mannheimia haemolytica D171]STY59725.1 Uncharacterised protein [Mannheimia haemolytica]
MLLMGQSKFNHFYPLLVYLLGNSILAEFLTKAQSHDWAFLLPRNGVEYEYNA